MVTGNWQSPSTAGRVARKLLRLLNVFQIKNKNMQRLIIFCLAVVASGWILGYFLANEMRGKQAPTPLALIFSLGAVATPALLAIILSAGPERLALLKQGARFSFPSHMWLVALAFPFFLALVGHVSGVLTAKGDVAWIPGHKFFQTGLQMIPIAIIWGLLEEVGWRGFLVAHLAEYTSAMKASLIVGLIWGIWHAPQMFFSDQPFEGAFKNNPLVGAIFWTAACVAYGGVLGWLQLRTGSFVLPTLAHALINICGKISEGSMAGRMHPLWAGTGGIPGVAFSAVLFAALFHFF